MSAKCITFEYEKKNYTLEFNRSAVKQMERNGFKIREFEDMPMSCTDELYRGSFYMHHPGLDDEVKDKIWDEMGGHQELIIALIEMYRETVEAFMDAAKPVDKGNVRWTRS